MSPFLFALSMEYLSRKLKWAKRGKELKYHPRCSKLGVTHLCLLMICCYLQAVICSLWLILINFLEIFQLHQGCMRTWKIVQYTLVMVMLSEREKILQQLGYTWGELPFKYLGIPLSTKKILLLQWQPRINKIVSRISSWTAKTYHMQAGYSLCKLFYLIYSIIGANCSWFLPKSWDPLKHTIEVTSAQVKMW